MPRSTTNFTALEKLRILNEADQEDMVTVLGRHRGLKGQHIGAWRRRRRSIEKDAKKASVGEDSKPNPYVAEPPSVRVNGVKVAPPDVSGIPLIKHHLQEAHNELAKLEEMYARLFGGGAP